MNIAVLSSIALSGLMMYVFRKREQWSEDRDKLEVEHVEDKKTQVPDFVDYSGGTWGI